MWDAEKGGMDGVAGGEISYLNVFRILLAQLSALSVFWVGFSWTALAIFCLSFYLRAFSVAGGYHRYFSHRSYKTSRLFQFLLALLGTSSGQKGPLSWATSHRLHHRFSDSPGDPHSPHQGGVWHAYLGWLFPKGTLHTDYQLTADFAKYPEIVFLNKYHSIGPLLAILAFYGLGSYLHKHHSGLHTNGLQLVVWGFVLSTFLNVQGTILINTLCHTIGARRFETRDRSTNVWWLFPITLGENWHHNHHFYPWSANAGLYWWEFDLIFWTVKGLEKLGLVWEVRDAARQPLTPAPFRIRAGAEESPSFLPGLEPGSRDYRIPQTPQS